MVGDHAQVDVVGLAGPVAFAGEVRSDLENRLAGVDLVDVVDTLQQRCHALQAHPGVDVLGGQRLPDVEVLLGADFGQLVLHEHQVPDLEVAVLVDDRSALLAILRTAIVVDL